MDSPAPKSIVIGVNIDGTGLSSVLPTDVTLYPDQGNTSTGDQAYDIYSQTDTLIHVSNSYKFEDILTDAGTDYHKLGVEIDGEMFDVLDSGDFTTQTSETAAGDTFSLESVDGVLQWKIIPATRKRTTRKKKAE